MGMMRRLAKMDPAHRQISFLKFGLYSGCFFSVVIDPDRHSFAKEG